MTWSSSVAMSSTEPRRSPGVACTVFADDVDATFFAGSVLSRTVVPALQYDIGLVGVGIVCEPLLLNRLAITSLWLDSAAAFANVSNAPLFPNWSSRFSVFRASTATNIPAITITDLMPASVPKVKQPRASQLLRRWLSEARPSQEQKAEFAKIKAGLDSERSGARRLFEDS